MTGTPRLVRDMARVDKVVFTLVVRLAVLSFSQDAETLQCWTEA